MTTRAKREAHERHARLREVEIFAGCTDAELDTIERLGTEIAIDAGQTLTQEGAGGLQFMIVLDGEARVSREGRWVATVRPGSFVGEMALLDRTVRAATVTAATEMRMLVMNAGEFFALLDEAPGVKAAVLATAEARRARH